MSDADDLRDEPEWDDSPRGRGSPTTSGAAIASLILGILAFCIPVLPAIAAIILGIIGLSGINKSRGRLTGQGLAIAGIVLGGLGLFAIPVLVALLLPAVQKVREAANRAKSTNNLRQIFLAMHAYHDQYGCFPPAAATDRTGKPLYSWRVLLLPYLEQDTLYKQFKLDEPWDSPTNRPLLEHMPRVYATPGDNSPALASSTPYQVFVGPQSIFQIAKGARQAEITDGMATTLMVVEVADPVPWTKPADPPFGPNRPLPKLGGVSGRGFNALMADGSVLFLKEDTSEQLIRALITPSGNEPIDLNKLR